MGQVATVIPEKIYFKIGEVCDLVGVQAHVLRYWETEFPMLSPQKNRSGQRSYRRRDVEIAFRIKQLLYDEMFTIAGARKKLQSEMRETTKLKVVHPEPEPERVEEEAPNLFEDDLVLDDVDTAPPRSHTLNSVEREAMRALGTHLLELLEMLKTKHTRESEEIRRNDRV